MNREEGISLTLFFNGLEYHLTLPPNGTVHDLMNMLVDKFDISLPSYDLVYNNKLLTTNKPILLSQIIKNNIPLFMLRKKGNKRILSSDSSSLNVIIENYPNFAEMTNQILSFLSNFERRPKFSLTNEDTQIIVNFQERQVAEILYKFLNELKFANEFFKDLNIKMKFENKSKYKIANNNNISVRKKEFNSNNTSFRNRNANKSIDYNQVNNYYLIIYIILA